MSGPGNWQMKPGSRGQPARMPMPIWSWELRGCGYPLLTIRKGCEPRSNNRRWSEGSLRPSFTSSPAMPPFGNGWAGDRSLNSPWCEDGEIG